MVLSKLTSTGEADPIRAPRAGDDSHRSAAAFDSHVPPRSLSLVRSYESCMTPLHLRKTSALPADSMDVARPASGAALDLVIR